MSHHTTLLAGGAMLFYALFMVDGTTGWDEQFSLSSQHCQIEISLVE